MNESEIHEAAGVAYKRFAAAREWRDISYSEMLAFYAGFKAAMQMNGSTLTLVMEDQS